MLHIGFAQLSVVHVVWFSSNPCFDEFSEIISSLIISKPIKKVINAAPMLRVKGCYAAPNQRGVHTKVMLFV